VTATSHSSCIKPKRAPHPLGKRRPNAVERARARKAPWTQEAPSVPSQKPRDNLLRETDRTPGIEGVRHQQP